MAKEKLTDEQLSLLLSYVAVEPVGYYTDDIGGQPCGCLVDIAVNRHPWDLLHGDYFMYDARRDDEQLRRAAERAGLGIEQDINRPVEPEKVLRVMERAGLA